MKSALIFWPIKGVSSNLFKNVLVSYMRTSPPPNIANQYTEYYTHLVCIPIAAILIHCIRYRILKEKKIVADLSVERSYLIYFLKHFPENSSSPDNFSSNSSFCTVRDVEPQGPETAEFPSVFWVGSLNNASSESLAFSIVRFLGWSMVLFRIVLTKLSSSSKSFSKIFSDSFLGILFNNSVARWKFDQSFLVKISSLKPV